MPLRPEEMKQLPSPVDAWRKKWEEDFGKTQTIKAGERLPADRARVGGHVHLRTRAPEDTCT
jgi:hypothetical protein